MPHSFVPKLRPTPARLSHGAKVLRWLLGASLLLAGVTASAATPVRGQPFTRRYSLEDVGYGPRGARLDFDRFGRVAVIHDGVYAILNDTVWTNLADRSPDRVTMSYIASARDGQMYYGARASWGIVEIRPDGRIYARPLVPPDPPEWISSASFSDVITTRDGAYFVSPNGIAFWSFAEQTTQLYPHPRIARAFAVGDVVYVSAFNQPLHRVDIAERKLAAAPPSLLDEAAVELATSLDHDRALLSLYEGGLVIFDGQRVQPWEPQISPWESPPREGAGGRVAAIRQLADGRLAVAVTGKGLYLFSAEGEALLALTTPEYHRITAVANREPGVLWIAAEDGIEKVLYSSALTFFGQRLGLTLGWPIVERWKGRIYIASAGQLYRALDSAPGAPTSFELHPFQPEFGAWALAASGSRMLVGGADRVYAVEDDGSLTEVTKVSEMAHLIMTDDEHCYAIGRAEIALLEWIDGRWQETSSRTQGVTYPSVAHKVGPSVWIEMAGQVGRLWRDGPQLRLDIVPNSSWTQRPWINIGAVGDVAVLSADSGERRFFDESLHAWRDAPEISAILERSPHWVARVQKDDAGDLWATHDDGIIRFSRTGDDYGIDSTSFDLINDRYPVLRVLPGNDVWITASQSLYHVDHRWANETRIRARPVLVSLTDARGAELLVGQTLPPTLQIPFERNALTFRFFSGSDAARRSPRYEYRLAPDDPWSPMAGSQVSFAGLHEGKYSLQVRLSEKHDQRGEVVAFPFEILAPWYRTLPGYALFSLLGGAALFGLVRWASYIERRRTRVLERLVSQRTAELESAMSRLSEETRHAATLAERDRLANEIHDSVQQGLTGAILQLDTTLKLPAVGGDLRTRLNVVRNMVSHARQEVQHAVWDMESPLLDGADLAEALKNLVAFVDAEQTTITVDVQGTAFALPRATNHNLLRIAQEATTNALRHANATRVTISLGYEPGQITLTIADDGVGFDPQSVLQDRAGHLGLRGIRNRAKKLRGTLKLESAQGRGTTVQVIVPHSPDAADDDTHDAEGNGN